MTTNNSLLNNFSLLRSQRLELQFSIRSSVIIALVASVMIVADHRAALAEVAINHISPTISSNISPGADMRLNVEISGKRNFNSSLRALINRDGELNDLTVPQATGETARGLPEYSIVVPAPKEYLIYSFYFINETTVTNSKEYSTKRACRFDLGMTELIDSEEYKTSAKHFITVSEGLERENNLYETIKNHLKEIDEIINKSIKQ